MLNIQFWKEVKLLIMRVNQSGHAEHTVLERSKASHNEGKSVAAREGLIATTSKPDS